MSDMIKCIQNNIQNLRFSINFDVYEFNKEQQDAMLHRLDEIETIVNKVKRKNVQ